MIPAWRAAIVVLPCLTLVGARSPQQGAPIDFQARCESLVSTTRGVAKRPIGAAIERTIPLPGSPIGLLGAEWLPDLHSLAVFEGQDSRLTLLDTLGNTLLTIGRAGEGPAEFRLSPIYIGSRQKFRFGAEGRLLALDDRFAHLFAKARQTQEVTLGSNPRGLITDAHVARMRRGWIVSQSARLSADPAARTLVHLYFVPDSNIAKFSAPLLGTVRNPRWSVPVADGPFSGGPYDDLYRRTWDAKGSNMAVLSYKGFALCIGNPQRADTWHAWSTLVSPRRVDSRERERVLRQRFGRTAGLAPMMNVPVDRIFEGKWPQIAPFYYDVTALTETRVGALRLDTEEGIAVDLFDSTLGYLGTLRVPERRFVVSGYPNGLLLLDLDEGTIEFLRVQVP